MKRKLSTMTKLLVSLVILVFSMLSAFSQNDKRLSEPEKYDSVSIVNGINSDFIQRKEESHLLFPVFTTVRDLRIFDLYTFDASTKVFSANNKYNSFLQLGTIRNQPLIDDFNKSQTNRLFNKFYFYGNSRQVVHIAYGEYSQIGGALQWNSSDRLSFNMGGFFCRQFNFLNSSRSDIWGGNTQTRYVLTKKIQFNIWGQYVTPSNKNSFYGNSFFPNSGVGSSLLFNFRKQTQVDVGVKYRYFENKMNWNIESVGKISLGF